MPNFNIRKSADDQKEDRRLHKLRREELLDLLLEIEKENEQLVRENSRLRQQLEDKTVLLEDAGTLAEASARLAGLFASAQETADSYLENTKNLCERREARSRQMMDEIRQYCIYRAEKTEELCLSAADDAEAHRTLKQQVKALFETEEKQDE